MVNFAAVIYIFINLHIFKNHQSQTSSLPLPYISPRKERVWLAGPCGHKGKAYSEMCSLLWPLWWRQRPPGLSAPTAAWADAQPEECAGEALSWVRPAEPLCNLLSDKDDASCILFLKY